MESLQLRTDDARMGIASKSIAVLVLAHLLEVLTIAIKLLPPERRNLLNKLKGSVCT